MMKVEDILNQKVTFLSNAIGYSHQIEPTIINIFNSIDKYKQQINTARDMLANNSFEAYQKYKANNIPVWTPTGVFKKGNLHDNAIISYTNLMAIDIDVKDTGNKQENLHIDIDEIREDFFKKPYVVAILKSVSGKGLYALIYVEDGTKTKQYYRYFINLMKQQYDLDLDRQACNLGRKRFLSYEEDMFNWIKPMDYEVTPWKLYEDELDDLLKPTPVIPTQLQPTLFDQDLDFQIERTQHAIWALLNNGFNALDRGYWFHCGCDFANFPDGKMMWYKLCTNYGKQRDDVDKTWKNCLDQKSTMNDDLHRKWQGMAKNQLGSEWWKQKNSTP